jgi:hypothetical protein
VDVEPTYYAVDLGFRPPLRFPARGSSSARPSNSFSRSDIFVCVSCCFSCSVGSMYRKYKRERETEDRGRVIDLDGLSITG